MKKQEIKIQNDSPEIHYSWRDHRHLYCIRFYEPSVVLDLLKTGGKSLDLSFCFPMALQE